MANVGHRQLAKFFKENFPVARGRSPLWFFINEIKSNFAQPIPKASKTKEPANKDELKNVKRLAAPVNVQPTSPKASTIRHEKLISLWKTMDPESKRKYYNMSQFDKLRYQEQKSMWLSKVGALMKEHGNRLDQVREAAPNNEQLQRAFLNSIESLHESYDAMIQAESTKKLYKDQMRYVNLSSSFASPQELVSAIPEPQLPHVSRPKRPMSPFLMFKADNMPRYLEAKRADGSGKHPRKMASEEWADLSVEQRLVYDERSRKQQEEFRKRMAEYRRKIESVKGYEQMVDQVRRETKSFKARLRKRYRDHALLPLSPRNPFNFYVMDNCDSLNDLTESWHNLSESERKKYIKMSADDDDRYHREMQSYRNIIRGLAESRLFKPTSDDDDDDDDDCDTNSDIGKF